MPVVINVTASSALRPRCGELAAWAAILKPPGGLNIGQRADVKHPGKGFRVPCHGSVHVVK